MILKVILRSMYEVRTETGKKEAAGHEGCHRMKKCYWPYEPLWAYPGPVLPALHSLSDRKEQATDLFANIFLDQFDFHSTVMPANSSINVYQQQKLISSSCCSESMTKCWWDTVKPSEGSGWKGSENQQQWAFLLSLIISWVSHFVLSFPVLLPFFTHLP